jgi:RsiW-degrading membrane proteinase PrsW (M82 family)
MVLFALAIAPVIAIIWYLTFLDTLNKEPFKMLVLTFIFGLLSVVPAVLLEMFGGNLLGEVNTVSKAFLQAFVVVAFSEELAKYFFLRAFVFKRKEFDEPYDGIIYAIMISMGFAALENVMYVMQGGFNVGVLRMFTAVPAHATFAILMGYWVGRAKMENKPYLNWLGLLSAVAFHGLYDFFLLTEMFDGQIVGALLSLIIAIVLSRSAIKIHRRYKLENEIPKS